MGDYIISCDFASLYPTTMKAYSMKRILREEKIIKILKRIEQCRQIRNT